MSMSSAILARVWPLVPAHVLPAFWTAFFVVPAFYYVVQQRYTSRKKRAWIATALASGCMTLGSLVFVADYVRGGLSPAAVQMRPWLSEPICAAFMGYLLSDLILGAVCYREHVSLVMGWIHHSAYFALLSTVLFHHWSHIFALSAIMEFPTHLLAIASLEPALRSDYLFAFTFGLFRVAFHSLAIVQYALPEVRRDVLGGYDQWGVFALLGLAYPMHVIWFKGCIAGILRRAKQKRRAAAEAAKVAQAQAPSADAQVEMPHGLPTPAAEPTLALTSTTALDPVSLPHLAAPPSPPLTPPSRPSLASSLPRPPSLLSLPALPLQLQLQIPNITLTLPTRDELRRRVSKEGRQEVVRRLGEAVGRENREEAMRRLGAVWGAGRGVVRGWGVGGVEREEGVERRGMMVY